jgi:perosamine synthetase
MDLADAERKLELLAAGRIAAAASANAKAVGIIPVHVGGRMMDIAALHQFSRRHGLWIVEDAAHAFPAAWRASADDAWQRCGKATSAVCCFSFYANKTITTGEGGMAVTDDERLADRMRTMSLHGLSHDAWGRFAEGGSWDYRIVDAGYKYNLTDIAAAIGVHQLARAESFRKEREQIAEEYLQALADVDAVELPAAAENRIHAWHLFPIRLRLEKLRIDRNAFFNQLRAAGVGCSVHWRPLHMHPYYQQFGWTPEEFPVATPLWQRLISLPLFPGMQASERAYVARVVRELCARNRA